MGVRGFQTYIAESGLLVEHRLQDTILVIDGLNLENELYSRFLRRHDDKDYAGDYASFALYVEAFFKALLRCSVTPVVIMDGSFEDDKRKKKLERFDQRLKTAKAIYEGTSTGSEEINSLLNSYMFVQVIRRLKIAVYKSILEADDILPTIAADLNAPILSGDSDFLLENVSAGVINTKSFLLDDFQVHGGTGAADRPYLKCQLYRLSALQSKFRGLKAELVPIGGAILGNDYFDFNEAKDVINRLPKDRAAPRQKSFRFHQIHTVFSWLATQSTPAAVKAYLQRLVGAHHRMVQCIEDRYMGPPLKAISAPRGQSIAAYFSANYERLFPQEQSGGMPRWAHQRLVEEQLQKRAVSIFCGQVEFLRPLVEDYSLTDSSCQASFELCEYIYGLLRSSESNPRVIDRYVRVGDRREEQKVLPRTKIGSKRLPMLADIGSMSRDDRVALFYSILGIDSNLSADLEKLLKKSNIALSKGMHNELLTMLLSAIYMARHFSADLWIEFLSALVTNILLMGHFSNEGAIPKLLELDAAKHEKLVKSLSTFDKIPVRTRSYKARVVHQYNSFQNCLHNVRFLASVLDLAKDYHISTLVCGLQGTFIYNLTLALASQATPHSYLVMTLLPSTFLHSEFVSQFLNLVLANSKRTFIGSADNSAGGGAVLPLGSVVPLIGSAFQKKPGQRYLVRGGSGEGLSNLNALSSALGY